MPHSESIDLGGGSLVQIDGQGENVSVGPGSVGHYLTSEALAFGGITLTAADIAIAPVRILEIGNW
jgi:N-methylhydantoinase A/oxoprolinase/acetone carboxylase beta subunit